MSEMNADPDLLYGVPAIADCLKMRERQIYHLVQKGEIPTFKIGGKVCARKSSLMSWLAAKEAESRGEK